MKLLGKQNEILQAIVTALTEIIDKFADDNPWCSDPDECRERCAQASFSFMEYVANANMRASAISGFAMEGDVVLQGHFATLVGDNIVVDWTARQFDPDADCPRVCELAVWREQWKELGVDA